jgi:hypothetical protein
MYDDKVVCLGYTRLATTQPDTAQHEYLMSRETTVTTTTAAAAARRDRED